MMSLAPFSASSTSFTSPFTNCCARASRFLSRCIIIIVASGSSPFWRAASARVLRLGLNGRYMSSISVLSQLFSMRWRSSSVSFPCSSIVDKIVSLRLATSHSLSCRFFISSICTSSSPPVASFLYRLINGIVAPPSRSFSVLSMR